MKVEISIGEMHRFELRDALLIYRENRRSFITWHTVTAQKQGPPVLGPAQPLDDRVHRRPCRVAVGRRDGRGAS